MKRVVDNSETLAAVKQKFLRLKEVLSKPESVEELTRDIQSDVLQLLKNAGVDQYVRGVVLRQDKTVSVEEIDDNGPGFSYNISLAPGSEAVTLSPPLVTRRPFPKPRLRALIPLARQSLALLAILEEAIAFGLMSSRHAIYVAVTAVEKDDEKSDSESDSESDEKSGEKKDGSDVEHEDV